MLRYKIDVLKCLKAAGYNTNRLRKEKLISQKSITMLRNKEIVGARVLDKLCALLQKQPGDILEYVNECVMPAGDKQSKSDTVQKEGVSDESDSLH